MPNDVLLELARRRIEAYAGETCELMRRHAEAMACRDCEDFLRLGIDAHKWLRRAEETLREAAYEGLLDFGPELHAAIDALNDAWLQPCEFAERWIAALAAGGYFPENLNEFQAACESVRDRAERRDWQVRASRPRVLHATDEDW
jgi:hypothetical protein